MEIQTPVSPSSTTSSTPTSHRPHPPTQSWWESISKAQNRIQSLSTLLPSASISSLADSDRPALSLLDSPDAYLAISAALSLPSSGSGDDPLCHWLYDTFQSSDPDLRLVVLAFVPLLSGLYLSRVVSPSYPSLAGFEAVLLSIYSAEAKSRNGKPKLVSIPDLSLPSLYHSPPTNKLSLKHSSPSPSSSSSSSVTGLACPPLEPHLAVKSTKRACIVAVALDCYYAKIASMPARSKLDFCEFAAAWAGQDSSGFELDLQDSVLNSGTGSVLSEDDDSCAEEFARLRIGDGSAGDASGNWETEIGRVVSRGNRVPLPWELMQMVLKILGHCLLGPLNGQDVRGAASEAVRCVYARASHDLVPQAILASRSLIQLDKRARSDGKAVALAASSVSNPNTPSKPRKPEVFLVSK